ncbi:DUF1488 family protein [Sulfuricurvum sp.]|uniref:DUF1488 family protein n=1 Tax=Sulfuricurvum sp. TaxID=2025608 RepID=UPI003BB1963A
MITFKDIEPSILDQTVIFLAEVNGNTVVCKATYEFLEDINPATKHYPPLDRLRMNRSKIYNMMEQKLLKKQDPILTTTDLKK